MLDYIPVDGVGQVKEQQSKAGRMEGNKLQGRKVDAGWVLLGGGLILA